MTRHDALEWYAERARSLASRMDASAMQSGRMPQRDADYIMAVLTELALDGGRRARESSDPERVLQASVLLPAAPGHTRVIATLPRPARHHHILHTMWELLPGSHLHDQGFLTTTGRHVDREEGARLAVGAAQVQEQSLRAGHLFSEDLW